MKLKPLSQDRYTIWELLEYLGLEDHEWDLIMDHANHGNIQMQGRIGGAGPWIDVPPNEFYDGDFHTFTCTCNEAERFKKVFSLIQQTEVSNESASQYVNRRIAEGASRELIALELEAQKHKVDIIGQLLCNKILSGHADTDAYTTHRKRGYDLLKKAKKMNI